MSVNRLGARFCGPVYVTLAFHDMERHFRWGLSSWADYRNYFKWDGWAPRSVGSFMFRERNWPLWVSIPVSYTHLTLPTICSV